jgi:hypothetical protein
MSLGMEALRGRLGSTRRWAPTTGARGFAVVLALIAIAACEPNAPPGFTVTAAPSSSEPAATASAPSGPSPVAGKPSVIVSGTTVQIVGLGNGRSPDFELPVGAGTMTVSVCASNQVIPFVTLYDADDNKLGIIVEPTYALKALAGGLYYVDVASNPDCVWTIEIVPG